MASSVIRNLLFFVFLSMVALEFRQEQNSILIEIFNRQKVSSLVKDLLALYSLNKVLVFTIRGEIKMKPNIYLTHVKHAKSRKVRYNMVFQ